MRLKMIDRPRSRWPVAALLVGLLATFLLGVNGSAYLSLPGLIPASGCPTGAVLATDQFTTTGIPSSLTVSPNSTAVAGAWVLAESWVRTTSVVGAGNCPRPGSVVGGFTDGWPLNVMGALITTTITNARDADIQEMSIYQDTNFNGRFDPGIDLAMGRTYTGADLDAGKALFSNGGASPIFVLGDVGNRCSLGSANRCAVSLLAVVKIGPNPVSGSDFALQLEAVAGDIPGALPGGPAGGARVSSSFGASANPQGSNITLHIVGGAAPGGPGGGTPPPPPTPGPPAGGGSSLAQALDTNPRNNKIDDAELILATTYWSNGAPVPGTGGRTITDADIIRLTALWSTGAPIGGGGGSAPPPPPPSVAGLTFRAIEAQSLADRSVRLVARGQGIVSLEARVFTLSGRLVRTQVAFGHTLTFARQDNQGQSLANGVYLYIVTVKSADGQQISSEVKKLVVMR